MGKKSLNIKAAVLGSTLPVLLLLISLNTVWPDLSNYDDVFKSNKFDYASSVLITEQLFDYFKGPIDQQFNIPAFSNAEASHLHDVKIVLKAQYVVLYALLIIWLIVLVFDRRLFTQGLYCGGIAGFLVFLLLALIPFDSLFVWFHLLVFPQGNWLFEPGQLMVTIYPASLFESLAIKIFTRFMVMLTVSAGLGYIFFRVGYFAAHTEKIARKFI